MDVSCLPFASHDAVSHPIPLSSDIELLTVRIVARAACVNMTVGAADGARQGERGTRSETRESSRMVLIPLSSPFTRAAKTGLPAFEPGDNFKQPFLSFL